MRHFPEAKGIVAPNMLTDRLHYHSLFEYFPARVRSHLFNIAVAKRFKPGEIIFRRGDEGSFFGAIMSGRVRMELPSLESNPLLVTLVDLGEIFGETGMLDGLPRSLNAYAETTSTVLVIQRDDFLPVLTKYPEAMLGIIKVLCARIRLKTHTLELIALQTLPGRLARHLYRLAQEYGDETDGQIVIRAGLSQRDIGQQLATSRESVNRQLKIFVDKGYISLNGDEITLHEPEKLRHVAGTESLTVHRPDMGF
jgi:CRP/FNR family cyclic AMP-dependent transcriptional regulator